MKTFTTTVCFELTDSHISIVDDGSYIDDIIERCKKLCEVFDFEFELKNRDMECPPHATFSVIFTSSLFEFQHYINVLEAFAQEFQVNIASVSDAQP